MAKLTDEEKAKLLLNGEEEPKGPDETVTEEEELETQPDDKPAEEPTSTEEDKPETEEEEEPATFTKPEGYEWVKGDNLEEFNQNLMVAYENSTAEALRLRQTTPQQPVQQPAPAVPEQVPAQSVQAPATAQDPALAYAQSMMQKDLIDSFREFSKTYPQAKDPTGFDQFEKASKGAQDAFTAVYNRPPTYPELFEATAAVLKWSPSDKSAKKDAAIKAAGTSSNPTAGSPAPAPKTNISQKEVDVARRLLKMEDKPDSEVVKALSAN